jgi:hypothetical protein
MKAISRRVFGYTIPDVLVGATVTAVLAAGMFTTISALRKSAAASAHHSQSQVQQARIIDYISRDLRRALKVSVDSFEGKERISLTIPDYYIPDYYDASGVPREPVIDGSGVLYGTAGVSIAYYMAGDKVFRSVNGVGTELASGLDKFDIDYTDDGHQAITVGISFIPKYQYDETKAAASRAATATFATTLLRNKRQ